MALGRHQHQPLFTGSRYASPAVGTGTFAGRPVPGTRNTRCRRTVAALDSPDRCGTESARVHESGGNSACCFAAEPSWFGIGLIPDLGKYESKYTPLALASTTHPTRDLVGAVGANSVEQASASIARTPVRRH